MLPGLVVLVMIIVFLLLVAAPGGPLLLFILAATARLAVMLLAGPLSTVLALLVPPLIFSPLLLSEELNLSAILESMAFGAMDLAVSLVGVSWLLGNRQGPAGDTSGNFLAGVICLGFLGGAGVTRSLDDKHGFTFALPVAAPSLLRRGGSIFI